MEEAGRAGGAMRRAKEALGGRRPSWKRIKEKKRPDKKNRQCKKKAKIKEEKLNRVDKKKRPKKEE